MQLNAPLLITLPAACWSGSVHWVYQSFFKCGETQPTTKNVHKTKTVCWKRPKGTAGSVTTSDRFHVTVIWSTVNIKLLLSAALNEPLFPQFQPGFLSPALCATWWRATWTLPLCLAAPSLSCCLPLPPTSWSGRSWQSSARQQARTSCTATATGPDAPRWRCVFYYF